MAPIRSFEARKREKFMKQWNEQVVLAHDPLFDLLTMVQDYAQSGDHYYQTYVDALLRTIQLLYPEQVHGILQRTECGGTTVPRSHD